MDSHKREDLPKTVEKALDILDALSDSGKALGNTELSRQVGLNRSTSYRIVQTLTKRDYLSQNKETNKYQLGYRFLRIAGNLLTHIKIKDIAHKHLEDLTRETSQTAQLALLDGDEIIYIDQVDGTDVLQLRLHIGMRGPLYCTAAGKSILAFLNEEEAQKILERSKLKPFSPNTITSIPVLQEQLRGIRMNGYSFCNGEYHEMIRAVGAPIVGLDMKIKGAIDITIPLRRVKHREIVFFGKMVKKAALAISREIGGQACAPEGRAVAAGSAGRGQRKNAGQGENSPSLRKMIS